MTDPVSKGERRMEQALAAFNTTRHQLGDSPSARTLLGYQSALAALQEAIAHEVEHDLAFAREQMEEPAPATPSDLRPIAYGSLPLPSFIGAECREQGRSPTEFLAECRKELRECGPSPRLLSWLHAVKVTWHPPVGCTCAELPCVCIERDVEEMVAREVSP